MYQMCRSTTTCVCHRPPAPPYTHVLSCPSTQKTNNQVGVSINSDLAKLRRDWGIITRNSHDLGLAGGRVLFREGLRQCSLTSMAKAVWGVEMPKHKRVQLR